MARQLITLDEYKDYASINSIDFDYKIELIVNKVSEYVKSYCNRTFIDYYDKTTNEYLNIVEYSNEPGYFYTSEFPVNSLVQVEYSSDMGTTYSPSIAYFDMSKDAIYIDSIAEGINAYKITYTGGYKKTPEDLKLACLDLVEYYYKGEYTPKKSSGTNTVEYITTSDLPSHIKRVLDLYRVIL